MSASKPIRIALVNAPPYALREPQYDTPLFTRLSLAVLAAWLRQQGYDQLLLIDAKHERIGYREIRKRLTEFRPDLVGHTAFTNEIIQSGHVANIVRDIARAQDRPIINICGGVHCTAIPEETVREFPQFDLVAIGEGEETLLDVVRYLENDAPVEALLDIPGLAFRHPQHAEQVHITAPRTAIGDQTRLPMPAWDLLPATRQYTVMTSRGCPYRCNFCQNPNGRVVRKRTVEHCLEEMKWLIENMGCTDLHICDEIFTIDKARTHQILDGMIALGFGSGYTFHAQTHVNCVDEALLRKIQAAGCRLLGFGMETGDPETLKDMGKGTNLERIRETVQLAKRCEVKLGTYFILGQPNENWRSAFNTISLAIECNPETPIFGVMVPYPGTKIWEWALRSERGYWLQSINWNDYNKQIGNALSFDQISRRGIEFLQLYGYSMVFLRNRRFREFGEFVWRYRTEGRAVLNKIITGHLGRTGTPEPYNLELAHILALDETLDWDAAPPPMLTAGFA